ELGDREVRSLGDHLIELVLSRGDLEDAVPVIVFVNTLTVERCRSLAWINWLPWPVPALDPGPIRTIIQSHSNLLIVKEGYHKNQFQATTKNLPFGRFLFVHYSALASSFGAS